MSPEPRSARFPLPLTLLFVLCLALTGLAAAALVIAGVELNRSTRQVEHTLKVQQALQTLQLTLADAETGQRGFLLTGKPHFLEPYIAAVAGQAYSLGTLERLTADNPMQQQALRALKPLVDQSLRQLSDTITAYQATGQPAQSAQAELNRGKDLMDKVRVALEGMRNEEARVLTLRQNEVDQRGRYGIMFLLLSNGASLLGLAILYAAMRRYHWRRQRLEAAIVHSEHEFRRLFETSAVGQAECDPQSGRFLRANDKLATTLGYTVDELARTTLFDVLPRAHRLDNARAMRALVAGERPFLHLEQCATRKDGTTFWAEIHATAIRGDDAGHALLRIALMIVDVTKRRNSEDALARSHALLTTIAENTHDLVFAKDVEGRWLLANQAMLAALGKTREQVVGSTDAGLLRDAADAETVRAGDLRVMSALAPETVENTIVLAGEARTFLTTKAPYLDAKGELLGIVGIATDITRRKQEELALRESHDRLEQLVEQRTAQISELSQWLLRVQEEERASLAMELHDELNAAMTTLWLDIMGVLNTLKSTAPALVPRQQRALDTVVATSDKLRRLTEGLRPILLEHLGLAAALEAQVSAWRDATGISAKVEIDPRLPALPPGAELALFRIAQEALTNVAKYAHAGEVVVDLMAADGEVRLVVGDDGVGIPAEALDRTASHGITGMRERLRQFDGRFEIGPGPDGRGTRVAAAIPLHVPAPDT